MSNLVQPLAVLKTGTHENTVLAGAIASLTAGLQASPDEKSIWDEWLSGPFTKTTRRASLKQINALKDWAAASEVPIAEYELEDSLALAFPPLPYAVFPKELSRLQVAGTDFPRLEVRMQVGQQPAELELTVLASLTTGKATAQAAHCLWLWTLESGFFQNRQPTLPSMRLAFEDFVEASVPAKAFTIRDNGLTEIEANTLTAFMLEV